MKYYTSVKAICPFYMHENRFVVFCKGVCDESVTHVAFAKPSTCYNFKQQYCRNNHTSCPVSQMLNKIPYNNINI